MFELPLKVANLMDNFKADWGIAGGWAIDLFLNIETRSHADIEIAVFRRDQLALQEYLNGWDLQQAAGGNLTAWKSGEFLELPIHAIHCFNKGGEPDFLEVLLNESDRDEWLYRRNRQITKPLSQLFLKHASGIQVLAPEIVLLYKSKAPRAKDEQDFQVVAPQLSADSVSWLKNALSVCYGKHDWLPKL